MIRNIHLPPQPRPPAPVAFPFDAAGDLVLALDDLEAELAVLVRDLVQARADLSRTMAGRTAQHLDTELEQVLEDVADIRSRLQDERDDVDRDISRGRGQRGDHRDAMAAYEVDWQRWWAAQGGTRG